MLADAEGGAKWGGKNLREAGFVLLGERDEGQTISDLRNKDGADERRGDHGRRWAVAGENAGNEVGSVGGFGDESIRVRHMRAVLVHQQT